MNIRRTALWKKMKEVKLFRTAYSKLFKNHLEKKKKKVFKKNSNKLLALVNDIFNDSKYNVFPAFGTLLGIVRDGGIIPNDLDLDFAVIKDDNFEVNEFIGFLKEKGFEIEHSFKHDEIIREMTFYSPMSDFITVDFFIFEKKDDKFLKFGYIYNQCDSDDGLVKEREYIVAQESLPYFNEFTFANCNGINIKIPVNSVDLLKATYGESWNVPISNWSYSDKPSRKVLEDKKGYMIEYK